MSENKEDKNSKAQYSNRKPILTFSTLIENQQKEFEEFVRSSSFQDNIEKMISYSETTLDLFANQGNLISEKAAELLTKESAGISMLIEDMNKVLEESQRQFLKELEKSVSPLDSIKLLESSLNINFDELIKLEGSLIDMPTMNAQTALDKFCTLNVDIDEFKPIEASNNQYLLTTIIRENIDTGNIQYKTIQQTQLQVQSLYREVKEIKEIYIQDSIDKGDMLEELLDYHRNGGSSTVKVEEVKYNKKTAELIIYNNTINIMADTNQHYLCKILFANKASIKKTWEIDEIVEAWGEYPDDLENWKRKIYQTVRQLNQKIKAETGINKFIIYNNKTVILNPKYSN